MPKDYYALLGVAKNASDDDIKKAYRKLAHQHHPDKGGGDEAKFKDVNEAYQVLGDKQKRATYDRFGSGAFENGGMGGGQGGFGGFGGFGQQAGGFDFQGFEGQDLGDLGDVLGEMFGFGGAARGRKQARGKDIEMDVELSFREAAFGVTRPIRLYKTTTCSSCKGDGAAPGSKVVTCDTCKGAGSVKQAQRTIFGTVQTQTMCPTCHGRGKKPEKECPTCRGTGIERREHTLSVAIPGGLSTDEMVRLQGEGEAAPYGGSPGDLFLRIRVKADPHFNRVGNDVLTTANIPFTTMALGGEIQIDTLDGQASLDIPAGTAPETVFTLKGRGIAYTRGGGRGNHRVRVMPEVPKHLSKEQKELLEKLNKSGI